MRIFSRLISLLLCILFCFITTACDNTDKAYIYFRLSEKPNTLDPQTAQTDTELLIIKNIFEGLMRKDENGKIVCAVAQDYKQNNLTYTFNIRKDAKWSDGTKLTAHDFAFAFSRAVDPKTNSPFVSRLFCIANAEKIFKGKANIKTLGVKALDDDTLQIKLKTNDKNFLETLTTSISMPCKQSLFDESSGKYGLFRENILSNGSYRLAKWGKEIFGIRLYKNKEYTGKFIAKNAAVFLSHDEDVKTFDILSENDADIAFIETSETSKIKDLGYKTASYDNTCWFLTLSDGFSKGVRKSLSILANGNVFSKNLPIGYSVATSIFPTALKANSGASGLLAYDLETAKKIFSSEIANTKDGKFTDDIVLYYYDDGFSKTVVTDIVGHWQNHLGAYVNIESVSSPSVLLSQLKNQTYAMAIFPVVANSPIIAEYLQNFGIQYKNQNLTKLQKDILKSNNIVPLMFKSTTIAYSKNLSNINFEYGNGCIDFSFIIKEED